MLRGLHGTCYKGSMGHVTRAPWDMYEGSMGHVTRAPWDTLRGLHGTRCEGSMGHVARAPWDLLRGLHGTCCEGSMGPVARAPWDMLQGLHGTCCKDSMGYVAWVMLQGLCGTFYDSKLVTRLQSVPRISGGDNDLHETVRQLRAPWYMLQKSMGHGNGTCSEGSMGHVARAPWDMSLGLHGTCC